MNKKLFLLLLPVCAVFCISLTTCEEEVVVVTDLWDKLRNTVWEKDEIFSSQIQQQIIGFYGPNNGPSPRKYLPGDTDVCPYFATRSIVRFPSDFRIFNNSYTFRIGRTGKIISYDHGDIHISVSDNGKKLTLEQKNGEESDYFPINGTYTKISSDPNYNWDDNSVGGNLIDGIFELGYFTSYNADTQRGWCSSGTDGVPTNLTIDYLVSAKYLVLELDTVPTGGLQLIWQGTGNSWDWDQADDILDSNGNPNAAKGSILNGNKLTIELSKALKNYDDFVESYMAKILLGYYSPDIAGLGVIKAYLLYE